MCADSQAVEMTTSNFARQVFLDGDKCCQLAVPTQIGDAETTRFAKDFPHQVLTVHQRGAGGQQQGTLLC